MRLFALFIVCVLLLYSPLHNFVSYGNFLQGAAVDIGSTASTQTGHDKAPGSRKSLKDGGASSAEPQNTNESKIEVNIGSSDAVGANEASRVHKEVDRSVFMLYFAYCVLISTVVAVLFSSSRSNPEFFIEFINRSGLRYVALILILAAIALFGMMEVIGGKDVTVLLSAIAGYILGVDSSGVRSREVSSAAPSGGSAPATPAPSASAPQGG